MRIRFLSSNPLKIAEVEAILAPVGVAVVSVQRKIEELQTADVQTLVRDKCIKAFKQVGHRIFVEHTGLKLNSLNGFPDGLTQVFWDSIKAERFAQLFGSQKDNRVVAHTQSGYCDGRTIRHFQGEVSGTIPCEPRGDRSFQWDCVFMPDGHAETFAEMGEEKKNKISMRRIALNAFAAHLRELELTDV
jgi:XTP/dITP diphosphohydrolase